LPADPSADTKDPVPVVARVVSSASLFGAEHLPVYKEETAAILYRASRHRTFYGPDQPLVVSNYTLPSLRGPPCA
jgi:hemin uptake protein HemP